MTPNVWALRGTIQIDNIRKALLHQWLGKCPDAAMMRKKQNLVSLAKLGEHPRRTTYVEHSSKQFNVNGKRLMRLRSMAARWPCARATIEPR